MAVSIDWGMRVISVPRADMPLIQSSPIEIRELDLDWFRRQLKDLEDGEAGLAYPDTHRHNTEVTIAGLTFARMVEIVNGYTVTFEDGQYAVNMTGANSNVLDALNPNQVSVRSQNSAGLIVTRDGGGTDLTPVLDAISDLDGDVAGVHADVGTVGAAVAGVPQATLDGQEIVPGMSFRLAQRALLAAEAGLVRGATGGAADEWIEMLDALSAAKVRIRALTDQYGNRKQIQIDLGD